LNAVLATRNEEGMFVTVALAVVDTRRGRLVVASAGHPLPIVRDGAGHVMPIGCTGDQPLGLDPDADYREYAYEFEAGDSVVLYTDGVTEAANTAHQLYGDDRLAAVIARTAGHAADVVAALSQDVQSFAGSQPQSDDVTVVCFERVARR
ncbi:MAG TPA: PP2C family protein-serine/threonine phosphatase, partial [Rhodanobacteraceae bacterium]